MALELDEVARYFSELVAATGIASHETTVKKPKGEHTNSRKEYIVSRIVRPKMVVSKRHRVWTKGRERKFNWRSDYQELGTERNPTPAIASGNGW